MIDNQKPALLPASVPWVISPSAPYLKAQPETEASKANVTFIAYFRNLDRGGGRSIQYVPEPPEFLGAEDINDDPAPYRLVRITFEDAIYMDVKPAFSDIEVIPENEFDWTKIPGSRLPGEPIEKTIARRKQWWVDTGMAPDARIYEVNSSSLTLRYADKGSGYRHYILCGHDNYVEVIAKSWNWEPGQAVN